MASDDQFHRELEQHHADELARAGVKLRRWSIRPGWWIGLLGTGGILALMVLRIVH